MASKTSTATPARARKKKPAERPGMDAGCHFCRRLDKLVLTRVLDGDDERLIWACKSCRG